MNAKATIALIVGLTALAVILASRLTRTQPEAPAPPRLEANSAIDPASPPPEPVVPGNVPAAPSVSPRPDRSRTELSTMEESLGATNKLERLSQIREAFHLWAAGDPTAAIRAARQLSDETERETALLTLVTEWTGGELSPASRRARYIAGLGLEAGLGMELIKRPDLAVLWATELTEGPARSSLLQQVAITLAGSDPAAALALGTQVPENERAEFSQVVYSGWAAHDTDAALQYVNQLPDPAEREGALQAVRTVAPVGIGAELRMQDGYAVINQLVPGMPAELSGQLHPGDRIVALSQGDNSFVDARNLPLADVVQLIRGNPGTQLQLQVLPADAQPDSVPRTVSIIRDQIKFKK